MYAPPGLETPPALKAATSDLQARLAAAKSQVAKMQQGASSDLAAEITAALLQLDGGCYSTTLLSRGLRCSWDSKRMQGAGLR